MSRFLSMRKGEVRDVDDELAEKLIADGVAEEYNLVEPAGKITFTENGSGIDVSQYAEADVNVPASAVVSGNLDITANATSIDVTNYESATVWVEKNKILKVNVTGLYPASYIGFQFDKTTQGQSPESVSGKWGAISESSPSLSIGVPYTNSGINAIFMVYASQEYPATVNIAATCTGKTITATCVKLNTTTLVVQLSSLDSFTSTDVINVALTAGA